MTKETPAPKSTFHLPADGSTLYRSWGAHVTDDGVRFAVWAPNAAEVCVISDGNGWQHGNDYLNSSNGGVWWGDVFGMCAGAQYKYSIRTRDGRILEKADPVAFATQFRPETASIVADLSQLKWSDDDWMQKRARTDWLRQPISMYEVHMGSWRRPWDDRPFSNYREIGDQLAEYLTETGFTHVQFLPVTEHPFDGSWGYQTTGYFAPSSRFGSPEDFAWLVNRLHRAGIGVLIDWVPGHFPTDEYGLACFDGTCLYEHADPRLGFHPDWNTLIFNYGRNEVCEFLLSSARFWHDVYHVDGIRVDAVASMLYLDYSRDSGQWIPNQHGGRENIEAIDFLKSLNTMLHAEFPGALSIAEESTAWPGVSRPVYTGGLGFTMKWDMGWMNDTLRFMQRDPIHRSWHLGELSFRAVYAWHENFVLPLSHDEVVHGKKSLLSQMPGDRWQQFANLRLLYAYQFMVPGKKLLFMGSELAPYSEWNHDVELDWSLRFAEGHEGVFRLTGDLNRFYRRHPGAYSEEFSSKGFEWIQCDDADNCIIAFIRHTADGRDPLIAVFNLTPTPRNDYRIGVPGAGYYREAINTDASWYGGTEVGNQGGVYSEAVASHGRPHSISITVPPLAALVFETIDAAAGKGAK